MKKRPLGTLCLIVTGFIFLVTKFFPGEKESLSFSEEEICITGTVYQKELSAAEEKPVLYIKDICFEGAEGQEEITSIQAVCYLRETSKDAGIGSRITIKGCPWEFEEATNPGQFDRKFYYSLMEISFGLSNAYVLAESGDYHPVKENLFKLRSFCVKKLEECLREEEAGVLKAVLLGTKASVEAELKALYQRNGIAHILAISGLHISMLGMGAYHLLRKLGVPMGIAAGTAAALMICYGIMTGFSVSVLRAVIMFLINMLAKMVGRTYDMLTALGVAAVLVLLEQPMYLYYGGFVFSFGCVLGIGVCMPALTEGKNPLSAWKKRVLSGGAIAVISYPMYLWFYYQFPPYSVILNLFVVPLMSFLMIGGILIIVLQCFVPRLVFIPVLLIRGILKIYEFSCNACEKLPGHMFTPGKPGLWQLCFYLGILLLFVVLHKQKKKRPSLKIKWLGVLVGVIVLSRRPGNYLEITFLDVGQGDCIYVKSREGNHYLIDGGSTSVSEVGKYRILPFLKYKGAGEVEAVIVTHPDADHINGVLELLACGRAEGIRIKALVLPQIE